MSDSPGSIEIAVSGAIGRLTIVRPEKRNALSSALWAAVPEAIAALAADDRVRVLVVTGAGSDFSAGADIGEFETVYADRDSAAEYATTIAAAMDAVAACDKPTLAMIRGSCIGSGLGLALCCDLRFAAIDARFAITPGKLGLAYSFEDTRRLVDAVGPATAKDMLLSARTIEAEEAFELRLVDRLCESRTLEAETDAYALQIAATSMTSARIAKRFVALAVGGQRVEDEATQAVYLDAVEGSDFDEGRRAFLERRAPRFVRSGN